MLPAVYLSEYGRGRLAGDRPVRGRDPPVHALHRGRRVHLDGGGRGPLGRLLRVRRGARAQRADVAGHRARHGGDPAPGAPGASGGLAGPGHPPVEGRSLRMVVPTAGAGIFTAIMLALARGLGETAPILLTALGNDFINTNPLQPTDAVPLRIYEYARTPVLAQHEIAWGAAICLLVVVLILSITARVLSNRQQTTAQVSRRYRGLGSERVVRADPSAARDVNVIAESQSVTAVIGPSGCGKSTFIRCLNRMHEEVRGARVRGQGPVRRPEHLRARRRPGGGPPPDRHGVPAAQPFPHDERHGQRRGRPEALGGSLSRSELRERGEQALRRGRPLGGGQRPAWRAGRPPLRRAAAAPVHRPGPGRASRRCC